MAMTHPHHALQHGVPKFDTDLKCPVKQGTALSYREPRDRLPSIADITVTYAQSTIQDRETSVVRNTSSESECDSSESRQSLSDPREAFIESSSKVTSTLPNFVGYPRERLDSSRPQFDDSQFQRPNPNMMRMNPRAEVTDSTFRCPRDRFEETPDRRLLNVSLPSVSTFKTSPSKHTYVLNRRDGDQSEHQSHYVKRELTSPAPVINSSDSTCFASPPPMSLQEPSPRLDSTQYSSISYSRSHYGQSQFAAPASVYSPPPSPGSNSFSGKALPCTPDCTPAASQSHPGYSDYGYPATPSTPDPAIFYPSRSVSSASNNYDASSEILGSGAGPPSQRFCEAKTILEPRQNAPPCSSASRSALPSSTSEDLDLPVPCSEKGRGNLYAVIDKVIIEFDGTTLLCRVCGDRSSGFHYGVHSCEGCKGFFRRSIQQKIQYRPCSKNQQCLVQKTNRNRCQYCRLKKCIEVGMSKDAVRFGRVPKNEKERIRQAMEKASSNIPQQDYNDDFLIQSITRSHLQSSAVANENMREIIRMSEEHPQVANIDPISDCPLNPYVGTEDFQQKFSPIVRDVVAFAKNIPGFSDIKHDDKITLLRACVFEVLLIRFARLIDAKNRRMITISGYIINASIYANIKTSNDFFNTLFTFVDRINTLKLSDEEMALFSAAIVINPKRQGLHELSKVSSLHKRIVQCLQVIMQRERPNDPSLCQDLLSTLNDLWILNGMHSKQTQAKQKGSNSDCDGRMDVNGPQTDGFGSQYPCYSDYPEVRGCPMRYSTASEYDEKRAPMEEQTSQTSPTSPSSSTFCPDEEMRSPGSADSGCSTDSGCSIESGCSSDSGCSMNIATNDHARSTMLADEPRETMSVPDDETTERFRKCYIKRKPNVEETKAPQEKGRPMTWHKPQKESEKLADSPVLRMCLEAPSTLKMDSFKDVYRGHSAHSHPHKKFRPTVDRSGHPHETLDYSHSSPRPSTTPSPSYSSSPSPSSSISSSPSRISSSPYSSSSSSNPSSPANVSILAHRLAMPCKKFPKTSSLLQSLSQESKFGTGKAMVSDTLHDCIMNDQSKIPRQHVLATASPSRYDCGRNSSPLRSQSYMPSPTHSMTTSPPPHDDVPPHSYSSPIPVAHSSPSHTPTGLGASAMSGCNFSSSYICDNAEPLNLSTKTPSPPPAMET